MSAYSIAGYQYQVEHLCPACTINRVSGNSTAAVEFDNDVLVIENWLRLNAAEQGIDYYDENTYDSSDYPKMIFSHQVESGECCGECGEKLM